MGHKAKNRQTETGMIPEDWGVSKVKDVARINELSITKDFKEKEIEYIDIASVENRQLLNVQHLSISEAPSRAKRIVRNNDILISTVRPNLKHFTFINKAKPNTIASTGFAVISSFNIYPQYLYYYLTTDEFTDFLSRIADAHTSAYPACNPDVIENADVAFPSDLEEQRTIAEVLGALDDKIAVNLQMNENLERIGQALFKRWFIDFEIPNEKGKPYKSTGGEMVDSELGEIPKGWKIDSILACADILSGGTPKTSIREFWDGNIEWVSAKDVTSANGTYILDTERKITKLGVESSNAKLLPANTTVITARGTVGNYCLLAESMTINQTNYGIKGKEEYSDIFIFFTIGNLIEILKQHSYGTVFDTITTKNLEEMRIILPPADILKNFNDFLSPIMDRIKFNLNECRTLRSLRDSLLPRLMSGKIRVRVQ